jgi:hypothetical protein
MKKKLGPKNQAPLAVCAKHLRKRLPAALGFVSSTAPSFPIRTRLPSELALAPASWR